MHSSMLRFPFILKFSNGKNRLNRSHVALIQVRCVFFPALPFANILMDFTFQRRKKVILNFACVRPFSPPPSHSPNLPVHLMCTAPSSHRSIIITLYVVPFPLLLLFFFISLNVIHVRHKYVCQCFSMFGARNNNKKIQNLM